MDEQWKAIPEWEGWYEVSDRGRIRRVRPAQATQAGRILRTSANRRNGYVYVTLCRHGGNITRRVHILLALAFIPNPENKPEVNHIDFDRANNAVSNLEWVTRSENARHSALANRWPMRRSDNRLSVDVIEEIRSSTDTQSVLSRRHKVSQSYISMIRTGQRCKTAQ